MCLEKLTFTVGGGVVSIGLTQLSCQGTLSSEAGLYIFK